MRPVSAAMTSGTNVAACTAARPRPTAGRSALRQPARRRQLHQRRRPASVLTSPHANWLPVSASTKAGRYVSPTPTITLLAVPSAVERRRSVRRVLSIKVVVRSDCGAVVGPPVLWPAGLPVAKRYCYRTESPETG